MGILNKFEKRDVVEKASKLETTQKKEKINKSKAKYFWDENGEFLILKRIFNVAYAVRFDDIEDSLRIPKNDLISIDDSVDKPTIMYREYHQTLPHVKVIEDKVNSLKRYKREYITTVKFYDNYSFGKWNYADIWAAQRKFVEKHLIEELSLQEYFKIYCKSKYKLIETEEELNKYLESKLSCDDWCRLKLVKKMKEMGLGNGFISGFADLIGNDLDKYYQMINLANECNDKDILMYLFTYKFRKKEDKK